VNHELWHTREVGYEQVDQYPWSNTLWLSKLSWDLHKFTRSLAKSSLSRSFLSNESLIQSDISEG
jgi:hypothetical protein